MTVGRSATTHGSFGELLQGYTIGADGGYSHFLYTLPVAELSSTVTIHRTGSGSLTSTPADRCKTRAAFRSLCRKYGVAADGIRLDIVSDIPLARGCASSTADILSACRAFFQYLAPEVPADVVTKEILVTLGEIEFSDYLLYPGIASCHQREQQLVEAYPTDLQFSIVGVDEGTEVATDAFHRSNPERLEKVPAYRRLFDEMHEALVANDPFWVGELATAGAVLHNDVLPKQSLDVLIDVCAESGGLGICVAHSGSMAGILFSGHQSDPGRRISRASAMLRRSGYRPRRFTVLDGE